MVWLGVYQWPPRHLYGRPPESCIQRAAAADIKGFSLYSHHSWIQKHFSFCPLLEIGLLHAQYHHYHHFSLLKQFFLTKLRLSCNLEPSRQNKLHLHLGFHLCFLLYLCLYFVFVFELGFSIFLKGAQCKCICQVNVHGHWHCLLHKTSFSLVVVVVVSYSGDSIFAFHFMQLLCSSICSNIGQARY